MPNVRKLRASASYAGVLLLCMIAFGLLATAAQKKVAAGSLFAPEKGRFNILLDGQSVGHEDFEIVASGGGWTAHGSQLDKAAPRRVFHRQRHAYAAARRRAHDLRVEFASRKIKLRARGVRQRCSKNDSSIAGGAAIRTGLFRSLLR